MRRARRALQRRSRCERRAHIAQRCEGREAPCRKPKKRHVESMTRLPTKRMATACWAFIVAKSTPPQAAPMLDFSPLQAANRKFHPQLIHKCLWTLWGQFRARQSRSSTAREQPLYSAASQYSAAASDRPHSRRSAGNVSARHTLQDRWYNPAAQRGRTDDHVVGRLAAPHQHADRLGSCRAWPTAASNCLALVDLDVVDAEDHVALAQPGARGRAFDAPRPARRS